MSVKSIPAAVCLVCWEDKPGPEGFCAKCATEFEDDQHHDDIAPKSEKGVGRIHFGMYVPDSTNYPDPA